MLTQQGTIDIYHDCDLPLDINQVVVYSENDYGGAAYVAAQAFIQGEDADAYIVSHLIKNMVFNQSVDFEFPGWPVHFVEDVAFININKWPHTPIMPIEEAEATWIYAYQPVRDTVKAIQNIWGGLTGQEVTVKYLTTTHIHDNMQSDYFTSLKPSEVQTYEFTGMTLHTQNELHSFFTPPAWLFPTLAAGLGLSSSTVFSGHESGEDIDAEAAHRLYEHVLSNSNFDGRRWNKTKFKRSLKLAREEAARTTEMLEDIKKTLEKVNHRDAPQGMWG
jgi:hypothetical protein